MKSFARIEPEKIGGNVFDTIGEKWLLITTKDEKNNRFNAMTASWGCMGVLWNKPVCVLFVRPQRHTFGLLEEEDEFSVNVLESRCREAYSVCGSKSGRDTDKIALSGLIPVELDGVCAFEQSELVLKMRRIYSDDIKEDKFIDSAFLSHYSSKDFHRVYVCEITGAYTAQ